jgi:serine/threonine protein kinase
MTMQLCNGGTLQDLISNPVFNDNHSVAEIFMWRILTELLQTLEFIHHERAVAHLDLLPQNVFLHWSDQAMADQDDKGQHLPDIYLGDFGLADAIQPGHMQYDLQMLHTTMIITGLSMSLLGFDGTDWEERFPRVYSTELRTCLAMLPAPWGFSEAAGSVDETGPSAKALRARIMPIAREKMAQLERKRQMVDYRFTKPATATKVELHETKSEFDVEDIDEPFSYALVDRETSAVLKIERKADAITLRAEGKGYIWIRLKQH